MPSWLAVTAERAVSRAMGGSCSMPLAAFTRGTGADGLLWLDAAWGDPGDLGDEVRQAAPRPNAPLVRARQSAPVQTLAQASELGEQVAAQLRAGGAQGMPLA
jgi:hydroxymethylbilane synthase